MVKLAGWLTGTQVSTEIISQALDSMAEVLEYNQPPWSSTIQPARIVQPGAGLLVYPDSTPSSGIAEPEVLDWTPERRTLVYRRPLTGDHPLYYIEDWPAQGNLLFASEPQALLALGIPRRLHLPALDTILRYGFLPAPWTLFRDIQVVPAGSLLRWQHTKLVINPATDFQLTTSASVEEEVEQLTGLLEQTISSLLPPQEPAVTLLHDTTASYYVAARVAHLQQQPGTLASLLPQAEAFARATALSLLLIERKSEPEYWNAPLTTLTTPSTGGHVLGWHQLLHTTAHETGSRIALSALGASNLLQPIPFPIRLERDYAPIWSQQSIERLQQEETWEATPHVQKLLRKANQFSDPQQREDYLALHLRLPDQEVTPALRLATAEHIALRSPFLSLPIVHRLASLPRQLPGGIHKTRLLGQLLERIRPDLTLALKAQSREPEPALTNLFANPRHELLQETLSPEALKATGLFDVQAIQELLQATIQSPAAPPAALILAFTTQILCHQFRLSTEM